MASIFTLTSDLGDIDRLGDIAGVGGYDQVKASSVFVELFGYHFCVLALDSLISSKRAAGRPKDLLTLPELEALRQASG